MLETLNTCPVCAWSKHKPFLTCRDYTVSQEEFRIAECENCGFLFTNPRPDEASSSRYYQSENYISHSDTDRGLINKMYKMVRKRSLKSKIKLINQLCPQKGNLLDVGCGTGYFLQVAGQDGWQITGTEPDPNARRQAEKNAGKGLYEGIFENGLSDQTFDIITLWHVLEHVHKLDESIERIKSLLSKKGTLLVAVPNSSSEDAKKFAQYWAAYDVPRHLYHFSPETFGNLMQKHELSIQNYLPMVYDAFYISLLSTQYQTGRQQYLKAFFEGWRSNKAAQKNQNNYSSVIYLIKHT